MKTTGRGSPQPSSTKFEGRTRHPFAGVPHVAERNGPQNHESGADTTTIEIVFRNYGHEEDLKPEELTAAFSRVGKLKLSPITPPMSSGLIWDQLEVAATGTRVSACQILQVGLIENQIGPCVRMQDFASLSKRDETVPVAVCLRRPKCTSAMCLDLGFQNSLPPYGLPAGDCSVSTRGGERNQPAIRANRGFVGRSEAVAESQVQPSAALQFQAGSSVEQDW